MKRNLVYVVGLGPGDPQFLTAQAKTAPYYAATPSTSILSARFIPKKRCTQRA